jgi:hypothetical protein
MACRGAVQMSSILGHDAAAPRQGLSGRHTRGARLGARCYRQVSHRDGARAMWAPRAALGVRNARGGCCPCSDTPPRGSDHPGRPPLLHLLEVQVPSPHDGHQHLSKVVFGVASHSCPRLLRHASPRESRGTRSRGTLRRRVPRGGPASSRCHEDSAGSRRRSPRARRWSPTRDRPHSEDAQRLSGRGAMPRAGFPARGVLCTPSGGSTTAAHLCWT